MARDLFEGRWSAGMTLPYPDEGLEKIKAAIDAADLYLRDMYPQTDREREIISKGRQLTSCTAYLYERLIATQTLMKRQAENIVMGTVQ